MPSFKPEKLRVNLRLTINRLKLLEKKKSEFLASLSGGTASEFLVLAGMWIIPVVVVVVVMVGSVLVGVVVGGSQTLGVCQV